MARLTFILCCLFLVLSIALRSQDACAVEVQVRKPILKLQVSNVNDAQICPAIPDDDSLLRKMLPLREHKHLKLRSELEGLAGRGVSQPGKVVG